MELELETFTEKWALNVWAVKGIVQLWQKIDNGCKSYRVVDNFSLKIKDESNEHLIL
jgi:hypothetical protein